MKTGQINREVSIEWISLFFAFIITRPDKYVYDSQPVLRKTAELFMDRRDFESAFEQLAVYYNTLFTYEPDRSDYRFFTDALKSFHTAYNACPSEEERTFFRNYFLQSIAFFYRINDIINRVDPLEMAFMLRQYEYDFYVEEIYLKMDRLNTRYRLRQFFLKRFDLKERDLDSLGHWGEMGSVEKIEIVDQDEESTANEEDGIIISEIIRPKSRRIRLRKRLEWGVDNMIEEIEKFKQVFPDDK